MTTTHPRSLTARYHQNTGQRKYSTAASDVDKLKNMLERTIIIRCSYCSIQKTPFSTFPCYGFETTLSWLHRCCVRSPMLSSLSFACESSLAHIAAKLHVIKTLQYYYLRLTTSYCTSGSYSQTWALSLINLARIPRLKQPKRHTNQPTTSGPLMLQRGCHQTVRTKLRKKLEADAFIFFISSFHYMMGHIAT